MLDLSEVKDSYRDYASSWIM